MHCLSLGLLTNLSAPMWSAALHITSCISRDNCSFLLLLETSTNQPASGFHTLPPVWGFFFFGSVFCFSLAGDPLRKMPLISSGLRNLVLSLDHMALQHAEKQHSRPRGIWDCSGTHSAMVTYRELSLSSSVVHSCFLLLCLTPILQFIECGGEP